MRCKQCDYRLWNLHSRACPECGSPFVPSEFEFVPGSVRFCCPHCDQDYYGTDLHGHLVPASFDCGSCNRPIHMDEMVVLPTEGVDEERTTTGLLPWLDRRRIGTVRAWFRMVGMGLIAPGKMGRLIPPHASTGSAVWFGFLTTFLITSVTSVSLMLFVFGSLMIGGGPGGGGAGILGILAAVGVMLSFSLGFLFVGTLLTGLVAHGVLRMTGDTAGGLGRTYRAVFYSSGANALTAVPCIGPYIGWIWWVVSGSIVLKESQRVHGGRAALAILVVPAGALAAFLIFYVGMIATFLGSAPFGALGGPASISEAIVSFRDDHGAWPEHGIELVTAAHLDPMDLTIFDPSYPLTTWSIDGTFFHDIPDQSPDRRDDIVQFARDALPENVIAHRVGDWVFTYHGIEPNDADSQLWIAVGSTDPECNPVMGQWSMLYAITADGQVQPVAGNETQALIDQNQVRKANGLAPLPDPATITHSSPVTAGK